jgi:hypothetical protein
VQAEFAAGLSWAPLQKVPGFAVVFEDRPGVVGGEVEPLASGDGERGGNDVSEITGDDVNGDEVEVVSGVVSAGTAQAAAVALLSVAHGGLDLNADKESFMFDGEVVMLGLAPGFVDGEAVLGGAGHEAHFCPLAARFWELYFRTGIGHWSLVSNKKAA